ncbi:MAG: FtsQ-type POTRA domain-containing protein [Sphaerochaetaceae bacterium]|nr:FtsQ-type POTRA domain-containing protein [Sphaerochaetaceae bacterium]
MTLKTIEKIIIGILFLLLIGGTYVGLRNLPYFDIDSLDISVIGPVEKLPAEMERIINPKIGKNLFAISTSSLKKELENFNMVKSAEIKRYFPNKLIINVTLEDMTLRAFSVENGSTTYYFVKNGELSITSVKEWELYNEIGAMELNPEYVKFIIKWGPDSGFLSMVPLGEHLASNNLISTMKYDNNNGSDFGRIILELPSLNVQIYIREPISGNRFDEALGIVMDEVASSDGKLTFDLYANALVKRT